MEESMLGIGKMVKGMVKELSLGLKGNMLENVRILKNGTE